MKMGVMGKLTDRELFETEAEEIERSRQDDIQENTDTMEEKLEAMGEVKE